MSLTRNKWYEAEVLIDDDPNDANLQQLRFWVNTGGGYGSPLITTTVVDDVWSAGYVGLYRAASTTGAVQQYDDVKIGYDTDSDADITDAGDDIQVSDDFNSNVMTLSYDNNGNLTSDGVYQYVYDGWNRLRKVQRRAAHAGRSDDVTTIGTYAYWPDNRRASKTVEHCGIEAVANDGGDTVVYFYYSNKWQILETRNGSSQATRQWVWGTRYVDEILFMDVNGDPATSNICDADDPNKAAGTRRYFYHQDRNWNVVALSEYGGDGIGTNGRIAERYAYTPYGEFVVLKGDNGSGELGCILPVSSVGNIFFHQGLPFDQEKGCYQNRNREYQTQVQRFAQRDPAGYRDGSNTYLSVRSCPTVWTDPQGRQCQLSPWCCPLKNAPDESCCEDAFEAGRFGTDSGIVVCCAGRKVSCSIPPLPGMDPVAAAVARMCIIRHEDSHHGDVSCSSCEGCWIPTRPPSDNQDPFYMRTQECNAYGIARSCLLENMSQCQTDECRQQLREDISQIESFMLGCPT